MENYWHKSTSQNSCEMWLVRYKVIAQTANHEKVVNVELSLSRSPFPSYPQFSQKKRPYAEHKKASVFSFLSLARCERLNFRSKSI